MIIQEMKRFTNEKGIYIHTHEGAFGIVKSFSLIDDVGYQKFWDKIGLEVLDSQQNSFKLHDYEITDDTEINFVTFNFMDGTSLNFSLNVETNIYSSVQYPKMN